MVDSIISAKNIEEAEVVILQAPYEKTASSHKGTVNGPKAIIDMLDSQLDLFDRTYKTEPCKKIKIGQKNLNTISKLSPEKALSIITTECSKLLDKNKFVFLLGGEHSVSLGLFQALAKKLNPKDVTIVQIDAHCDLRDSDADFNENPTKLSHGSVMRRACELGYNLVQIGIRTFFKDEYEYVSNPKNNIKVWQWGNGNKVPTVSEVLKSIKTKYVYISVDVDGFDPAHMPGTGTAVQGGLEWWYGVNLIESIIDKKELVGADIVEVSPVKDSVLTEYGAAQLVYTMIAHKFRDKLK